MDICSGNLSAFSLLVDFGQILRTNEKEPNEIEIEDAERSPSPMSPEQPSTPPATTPVVFENHISITKSESSVIRIIPQMPPLQQQQVPQQQQTPSLQFQQKHTQQQVPQKFMQQQQQVPQQQHIPPLQFQQKHTQQQVPQKFMQQQQQVPQQQRTQPVQVQHVHQDQGQHPMQLQDLQQGQQQVQVLSPQQQAKKRKNRRKHTEIQRTFICPMTGCGKAYGSEGACKTHVRIKHQDIFSVQQQSMTILTQFPLTQLN